VQTAEDAKDAFRREREVLQSRRMEKNRMEEQVLLEQLEEASDNDNVWERVIALVDMQQEHESIDTSRMRKIFIDMKNDFAAVSKAQPVLG
jgi:hypothetical protein